jgi:hypothetical protein
MMNEIRRPNRLNLGNVLMPASGLCEHYASVEALLSEWKVD